MQGVFALVRGGCSIPCKDVVREGSVQSNHPELVSQYS